MTVELMQLKEQAEKGKALYRTGQISRNEAVEMVAPYINAFNAKSKEIAKKYNQRPKLINFAGFVR